jgi:hypothetical protein
LLIQIVNKKIFCKHCKAQGGGLQNRDDSTLGKKRLTKIRIGDKEKGNVNDEIKKHSSSSGLLSSK